MAQTFIETYMGWTARSEAPARYHLFSALTVMAHALGRRVFLNQESVKAVFPCHMMTLLVGPSGLKKTTAIKRATGLLHSARGLQSNHVRINVMAERMSTEAMWDDLIPTDEDGQKAHPEQTDCIGLLVAPEMSMTFGNQAYLDGLTPALNRLADADVGGFDQEKERFEPYFFPSSFKKDKGKRFLQNASMGLLAGTTPDDLGETMPAHVRATGFLARVIPVWEMTTSRKRNLMLSPGRMEDDVRPWLVKRLAEFARLEGMCQVDTRATEYLERLWGERKELDRDPLIAAFENREEDHTHRIAIILACDALLAGGGRGPQRRIWLTREVYEQAWGLVVGSKLKLIDCYAPIQRKTRPGLMQWILAKLKRKREAGREPTIDFATLRRKVHDWSRGNILTEHLRSTLSEMVDAYLITIDKVSDKKLGYAVIRLCMRKAGLHSVSRAASIDRAFVAGVNAQLAEHYDGDTEGEETRETDDREVEQATVERENQALADLEGREDED